MPTLLISTYNGVEFVSVEYGDPQREPRLGQFRRIPITEDQASLSLETLKAWYSEDRQKTATQRKANAERSTKLSGLLERLVRIIQETKHDGERENAKDLYLKVTGKPYEAKAQ